ncbi:MAG: helix-turn-helix domain-containing protein [Desulfovibrionales bacterium]
MKEKIGKRIKKYRQEQAISVEELAERTRLAPSFISALEDEDLYPSLGPLLKITRTLGVRLGTFLDDVTGTDPCVVRAKERSEELTMHKARSKPASLHFHSLGKGKIDRHMEPFFIRIKPEPDEDQALSSHEGEEFILVHSGSIQVLHGNEKYELGPGDSIYFNSIVPHFVGCSGKEEAEIYAVLYFPE